MASTVLSNGIIIPEKYSRDWYNDLYHNWQELDNLLGGGTPKDGTLTIQKNGTTVGTFSANQATNETIDITVPTATSELTNDSNFVESSDLATVATSGSYNDLSNKPTIPTVNDATLTIQKNGTDVATFSANSSTNATANITVPTKTSDLTNDSGFITSDNTKIPLAGSNAISGSLIPATTNAYDLGGSSYQWKSLNGINPGALSLPSNNVVNILSELQSNGYTAPSNGYVRAIKDVQTNCTSTFGIRNETTRIEDRRITERIFILGVIVPVQAGEKVIISDDWNSVSNATVTYGAYFYPCQGNV